MRKCLVLALGLVAAGCGSSPSAPATPIFALSVGNYRFTLNGASCFVLSISLNGQAPAVTTVLDVQVALAPSGGTNWTLSAPGTELAGTLSSTGSTLSGTLLGSAAVAGGIFQTGPQPGESLSLSGVAVAVDRYEGSLSSGTAFFRAANAVGSSQASCNTAGFTLRRAS